jgi:transposase
LDRAELQHLVSNGLTIREIAEQLDRSSATVKKWLARYGLKTQRATGKSRTEGNEPAVSRMCRHHGLSEFVRSGDGYYRCRRCRVESVVRRRRRVKEFLAREAGGRCVLCGYCRYVGALQFHHLDPAQKRLGLSRAGVTLSLETLRAEAEKCVLLCSNCHAEVEAGLANLPIQ